jgi:hypothetical protein
MNLIRKRIKHLLREIESKGNTASKKTKNDYCIINIIFDTDTFNARCSSIGDFMKKLRNGKITSVSNNSFDRPKQTNREYFNHIMNSGGFYRYSYGYNFVEINIFLDVVVDLDYILETEVIKSRVSKVVPFIECTVGFNDKLLLDKTFRDLSILDTGWSVFGNEFRNKTLQ